MVPLLLIFQALLQVRNVNFNSNGHCLLEKVSICKRKMFTTRT